MIDCGKKGLGRGGGAETENKGNRKGFNIRVLPQDPALVVLFSA